MSHDLYTYGTQDTVQFALVDSSGASVTGHNFIAADVILYKDGVSAGNVGTECAEIGSGLYVWTPSAGSQTQAEIISLAITDSAGTTFLDNKVIMSTGGNASARFSG